VLWELQRKRFEENRGNRKLCHLNPFEFFDHTGPKIAVFSIVSDTVPDFAIFGC
jgi:hypothetical protein